MTSRLGRPGRAIRCICRSRSNTVDGAARAPSRRRCLWRLRRHVALKSARYSQTDWQRACGGALPVTRQAWRTRSGSLPCTSKLPTNRPSGKLSDCEFLFLPPTRRGRCVPQCPLNVGTGRHRRIGPCPISALLRLSSQRPPMTDLDRLCSLIGQGQRLFRISTPWDACVLCALGWRLMG